VNDHLPYLFAAYGVIFVAIFVYLLMILRRQNRLDRQLGQLEAELRELKGTSLPPTNSTAASP